MNYDEWKADAPDPGSGSYDTEANRRRLFWGAYRVAVQMRCVEQWLSDYRRLPQFAALVARADQMVCPVCEAHIYPDEDLCPTHQREAAMRSGEHHAA